MIRPRSAFTHRFAPGPSSPAPALCPQPRFRSSKLDLQDTVEQLSECSGLASQFRFAAAAASGESQDCLTYAYSLTGRLSLEGRRKPTKALRQDCLTYAYSLTGRSSLVGAEHKSASQRASETECARSAAAAATPTESSLWTTHRSQAAVHTAALAAAATEGGGGTDARDVSGEAGGGGAPGVGVIGLDRA